MRYFIMLALLFIPASLNAQEAVVLPEVLVEGRKIEEKLSAELGTVGHRVQVIEGKTIADKGYVDVYEALSALAPGLFVSTKTGRGDYATTLMNGGTRILWLLDGVRLNNRLYGSAYMDTISASMIERIEILYGGEGLFYGTDATSGVVNIITKKPTKETSGWVTGGYGSHNAIDVNTAFSGSSGKNSFLVFAGRDSWDGYLPFKEEDYQHFNNPKREKRKYDRNNIILKYNRDFGENNDKKLEMHFQNNFGKFDFPYVNEEMALNDRKENVAILKWSHDVTDSYSYYIKTYYHSWWTDYTRQKLNGTYINNKDKWGYQDWGVNILNSFKLQSEHEILMGVDYQNYYGKDEVTDIISQHEKVWAVFGQFRPHFNFWPGWKTALGLRYNYGKDSNILVWNVSSNMPLTDNLNLRFNTGTSFILPTAEQLWQIDNVGDRYGNPDLKPQKSFSVDGGLNGDWGLYAFGATLFYEDMTDRIARVNNTYTNIPGSSKVRGYNLLGILRPLDELSFEASYTRQKRLERGKEVFVNLIPKDYAKISANWNSYVSDRNYGLSVAATYTGRMHYDDKKLGDYWLADASAFIYLNDNNRVSVQLSNIFNKKYASRMNRIKENSSYYYYDLLGSPFSVLCTYTYSF